MKHGSCAGFIVVCNLWKSGTIAQSWPIDEPALELTLALSIFVCARTRDELAVPDVATGGGGEAEDIEATEAELSKRSDLVDELFEGIASY